jgi:ComF family protein
MTLGNIKNHALTMRDFILDILFPINCVSCGQEGRWLCSDCYKMLNSNKDQFCPVCEKANPDGRVCIPCRPMTNLDGVISAGDYQNKLLADLIKKLKYNFAQDVAKILSEYLSDYLQNYISDLVKNSYVNKLFSTETIIVPVPLHKKRLRWRGFNQAEKIADEISQRFGSTINNHNLIRRINTTPQVKLNEKDRRKNLINVFAWQGDVLSGQKILLFDDVVTTGATLDECAKILKQNGASEVYGLTVARG